MRFTSLSEELKNLQKKGCRPAIYCLGNAWRGAVNIASKYWVDDESPLRAIKLARRKWEEDGSPNENSRGADKRP